LTFGPKKIYEMHVKFVFSVLYLGFVPFLGAWRKHYNRSLSSSNGYERRQLKCDFVYSCHCNWLVQFTSL